MLWTTIEADEALADGLCKALSVSKVMGRLLVQRGLTTVEAAQAYLRPRLSDMDDPFRIKNLEAAAARIGQAIDEGESVVVFGDYDVDGITSTVQLVSVMRVFGLDPRFCVPLRMDEGYGLSRDAINRVFDGEVPRGARWVHSRCPAPGNRTCVY